MNYVVLDLEWNQSPDGKANSIGTLPFEVIQIGAVKLDDSFRLIDQFSEYIVPVVYRKLHRRVSEIIGCTMEDLLTKGQPFAEVMERFLEWCGEDYMFCTWGSMDLTELQRNMEFHVVNNNFPSPFLFYDLQKLYSICYQDGKARITLKKAAEELGLKEDEEYHNADSDARYTAKVMAKLDWDKVKNYRSVDLHRIPSNRKQEYHLDFGEYEKYVSRGFATKDAAVHDREVRSARCFKCGRVMRRDIKWFSSSSKNYYGVFVCPEHGYIKGRFKVKQTDDDVNYVVRIMKLTDELGVKKVADRQLKEREHRRNARRKKDN